MKGVYWRPQAVSRIVLVLIASMSVGGLAAVEFFKVRKQQDYYDEKLAAAQLASRAFSVLREERLRRNHDIDPEFDPAESGMIGEVMTPVTSTPGSLTSKQTSVNPNFAAAVVEMLRRARVKEGDLVAVGCSGSFPALNVCVYAALATIKAKPIIIASAASSQWGANFPDFLWIDMERVLQADGTLPFRSVASSIGGYEDLGLSMTEDARKLVLAAIERNHLKKIEADNFPQAIEQRMALYRQQAGGKPIKCYINIGGGTISVGRSEGKKMYEPGLNLRASRRATAIDSIMSRFMREGTPVIHMVQSEEIARKYGLPTAPQSTPTVGVGPLYVKLEYNPWLAGGLLAAIFFSLHAFLLSDLGFRLIRGSGHRKDAGHPQPMV